MRAAPTASLLLLLAAAAATDKAMRYYRSGNLLWMVDVALGVLIPGVFVFTGDQAVN